MTAWASPPSPRTRTAQRATLGGSRVVPAIGPPSNHQIRVCPRRRRRRSATTIERKVTDDRFAALYDPFFPPTQRDDVAFYLPLLMSARAVLDVGCGTGALLHLARDAGHPGRLCSLNPAQGMLNQARRRADIGWILGDLASVA